MSNTNLSTDRRNSLQTSFTMLRQGWYKSISSKASKAVLRYVGISNPEQEQLIREIEGELGEPDPETLAQFIEAGFAEAPQSTSGAAAQ